MNDLGKSPRNIFKIVLFVTILIFAVVAFLSYKAFMRLSLADMCGVDIVNERYSENKKVRAVLYQFDCGAMDSFSTQVSVLNANEDLPEPDRPVITIS